MDVWSAACHRRLECVHIGPCQLRAGDRVRLRPCREGRPVSDILDLVLEGKAATIESIEEDLEGRAFLAVLIDDDPGKDLGALRQPGHRFFYSLEDVEPLGLEPPQSIES